MAVPSNQHDDTVNSSDATVAAERPGGEVLAISPSSESFAAFCGQLLVRSQPGTLYVACRATRLVARVRLTVGDGKPHVRAAGAQAAREDRIDVLRAVAIGGVLVQHGVSGDVLHDTYFEFHARQAVPIFIVLMGLNAASSFQRRASSAYSAGYFTVRLGRLGAPYLVTWVAAVIVAAALGGLYTGPLLLVGYLPITGPGTYYLTFLWQAVLVMPLLVGLFWRFPRRVAVATAIAAMAYDAGTRAVEPISGSSAYLFSSALPQYLPLLVLGIWLAGSDRQRAFRQLTFVLPVALVALFLVHTGTLSGWGVVPSGFWGTYTVYSAAFPAWVVTGVLSGALVPRRGLARVTRASALVGRASYHIFLAQIVTLGALGTEGWDALLGVALALSAGLLAYAFTPRRFGGATT